MGGEGWLGGGLDWGRGVRGVEGGEGIMCEVVPGMRVRALQLPNVKNHWHALAIFCAHLYTIANTPVHTFINSQL